MSYLRLVVPVLLLSACSQADAPSTSTPTSTPAPTSSNAATDMSVEQRGATIFKRCRACHTLDQDGRHKVGPNLWAVYGSAAGSKEGYAYSKAMLASDITWDAESMDAYLKRPADYVPRGKMSFIGLKKQQDRDAVQAYIRAETTP